MRKFIMECPQCGKYTEASTGFFAKKRIDCVCGYTINVRADKMASRDCPHCGNNVIYDQSKGEGALCPVCKEKINTAESNFNVVTFSCPSCSCRLTADRSATSYVCPLCETKVNVQQQYEKEKVRKQGLVSIIKYEGDNDTFVWKHPIEDFNYGSQLIVHESQEALFFSDGKALDLFGAGRHTLSTANLPMMEQLLKMPVDANTIFHSEVYFINKTVQMGMKWGTPDKVRFIEPVTHVPLEIGASGELNLQVSDSRRLVLKLVGTMKGIAWEDETGFSKSLSSAFRPMITTAVKANLANVIQSNAIDVLDIDASLGLISEKLKEKLNENFEEYGLTMSEFYVTNIVLPENDPNFKSIKKLHETILATSLLQADATIKTAQAAAETQYMTAQEQSKAAIEIARREAEMQRQITETDAAKWEAERLRIQAEAKADAFRAAGFAAAEVMQAKGYTGLDQIQADVQKAYAKGIGEMGANGGGGGALNEIVGLTFGMATAANVAPQVGSMVHGFQQQVAPATAPATSEPAADTWNCGCGAQNISSKFCPECGKPKPVPVAGWNCSCGMQNIQSKFCPECGSPKPAEPVTWNCSCGTQNIKSKFCPDCGSPKPAEPVTWDCSCGMKNIKSGFCPECGSPKPAAEQNEKGW